MLILEIECVMYSYSKYSSITEKCNLVYTRAEIGDFTFRYQHINLQTLFTSTAHLLCTCNRLNHDICTLQSAYAHAQASCPHIASVSTRTHGLVMRIQCAEIEITTGTSRSAILVVAESRLAPHLQNFEEVAWPSVNFREGMNKFPSLALSIPHANAVYRHSKHFIRVVHID